MNALNELQAVRKIRAPKPKLVAGVVYSGDNGRLFCVRCAGMTALFSGRDLSGQRVYAMTQADADSWLAVMGNELACESGCTVHKASAGVKFSEAKRAEYFEGGV